MERVHHNARGDGNTAIGVSALRSNPGGYDAIGSGVLGSNSRGALTRKDRSRPGGARPDAVTLESHLQVAAIEPGGETYKRCTDSEIRWLV